MINFSVVTYYEWKIVPSVCRFFCSVICQFGVNVITLEFFSPLKCFFGQVECSSDHPAVVFLRKVWKVFAQTPKKVHRIFKIFLNNFFRTSRLKFSQPCRNFLSQSQKVYRLESEKIGES